MPRYLLGFDLGSSSVKASLVNVDTGSVAASAQSPAEEMAMEAVKPGWAEQDPEMWWEHLQICTRSCVQKASVQPSEVAAIGISYQMHGLVCVDANQKALRPSIIWCDSRAVDIGNEAFKELGEKYCLETLLNSPGNFTASKLKWVKDNEPSIYEKIHKIMLPGDFIAMKLTGDISTTASGLSEGMFWDYDKQQVAEPLLENYGIDQSLLSPVLPTFSIQGRLKKSVAETLGLNEGTPVSYRAGDQPNNAFSLNVLNPGETAATAGTSGVIYSVTEKNAYDRRSRVNTFMHVNSQAAVESSKHEANIRNGVLLCINGTGILNSWLRKTMKSSGTPLDYNTMNAISAEAPIGTDGLTVLPFGNGAERVLENKNIKGSFHNLDFNRHRQSHVLRAAQEGIVFALRYGFDVLNQMGLRTRVIRAGNSNMFLSPLFREAFVNTIDARLELYDTDGAKGAALGAGVGAGIFGSFKEAFNGLKVIRSEEPSEQLMTPYAEAYEKWLRVLKNFL